MQVPEPTRLVSPSEKKRRFMEQKRAEAEARRRQQTHDASAELTKVTAQVCAASQILTKASLLCIQHVLEVHPERDGDWLHGAVGPFVAAASYKEDV